MDSVPIKDFGAAWGGGGGNIIHPWIAGYGGTTCGVAVGGNGTVPSGTPTPSNANRCIYIPFTLDTEWKIGAVFTWNAGTASGHWDIGVFDHKYGYIDSVGTQAMTGTATLQVVTHAKTLQRGRYFMAFAVDNTTARFIGDGSQPRLKRAFGMTEQLSTYPLPTGGATPTALTDGYVPVFGFLEAAAA